VREAPPRQRRHEGPAGAARPGGEDEDRRVDEAEIPRYPVNPLPSGPVAIEDPGPWNLKLRYFPNSIAIARVHRAKVSPGSPAGAPGTLKLKRSGPCQVTLPTMAPPWAGARVSMSLP